MTPMDRAAAWLAATTASNDSVADKATLGNLRRLRWLVLVIIPINLMQVAAYWWGVNGLAPDLLAARHAIGLTHLYMAAWLVVAGLAAHRLSRPSVPGRWARLLQAMALSGFMLFATVLAVIDQGAESDISPFLRGCVVISLFFLMRPLMALGLFLAAYTLLFLGLGVTQPDAVHLLTNRVDGLAAAVIGLVLSLVLWHKNRDYGLLQRELESRNAALTKQQEELVWLARRDPLTGLFNRGEFLRLAEVELKRAQRHHTDTSVIMVDLDYFKRINDVHGHPAGDGVLQHAAALLLGGVRATDVVARIGGEEFMVLLPQTPLEAAHALAEKLLHLLAQSPAPITSDLQIQVTASFGVGTLPAGQAATVAWLYAAADHALYRAKRLGRNRVEMSEPDGALTASDFQRMRRQ